MNISPNGIDFIKGFEALRLFAYPDPDSPLAQATRGVRWGFEPAPTLIAGLQVSTAQLSGDPWTIGYGHTEDVSPDETIDEHQADVLLESDLADTIGSVNLHMPDGTTQNQFDACVSFAFNVGTGAFERSTLLKLWRAGKTQVAAGQFKIWCHDNGKVVQGLLNRRTAEAALFLKDDQP